MRHTLVPLGALILLLAAALPAAAQSDCTMESDPCPLVVTVDASGILGDADWTLTQDEWHQITVSNLDTVAHTVTLSGYGITITAPADGDASATVQVSNVGTFTVKDMPTGKTGTIHVTADDSIGGSTTKKAAGPEVVLAAGALALGLLLRKRLA